MKHKTILWIISVYRYFYRCAVALSSQFSTESESWTSFLSSMKKHKGKRLNICYCWTMNIIKIWMCNQVVGVDSFPGVESWWSKSTTFKVPLTLKFSQCQESVKDQSRRRQNTKDFWLVIWNAIKGLLIFSTHPFPRFLKKIILEYDNSLRSMITFPYAVHDRPCCILNNLK